MSKSIKAILNFIIYFSGINYLSSLFLKDQIFVFAYHSISSPENLDSLSGDLYENLSINAAEFEKQILFLIKNGHTFITFSDLSDANKLHGKKPTIIYFDDGFRDVLLNAAPILKKYGIPAVVFVTSGLISRTHFLWTLKYRFYLKSKGVPAVEIEKRILNLKGLSDIQREKSVDEQYRKDGFIFDLNKPEIFLDWNDIKSLSDLGWEIGSHGVAHCRLTETNEDQLAYEVKESKRTIENELHRKVRSFSYPYGRWNDKVNSVIKEAGYEFIVSEKEGLNEFKDLSGKMLVLKNIAAKPFDNLLDFKVKTYFRNFLK